LRKPAGVSAVRLESSGPNGQQRHLYPEQEAAIFLAERYGLIEASTKAGKMVGSLAWLAER